MINVDHVRVSFQNYRGTQESAKRVARLAMERLEQMSSVHQRPWSSSRTVERAVSGAVRIQASMSGEEEIAELVAVRAWQTILGHM